MRGYMIYLATDTDCLLHKQHEVVFADGEVANYYRKQLEKHYPRVGYKYVVVEIIT